MTGQTPDALNKAATFLPADPDGGTLPAVQVGGVIVFAYFEEPGVLRVSVDLDDVEPGLTRPGDDTLPMVIKVQGSEVFADIRDGERREPQLEHAAVPLY